MDAFEVPYGGKAWVGWAGFLLLGSSMAFLAFAATQGPNTSFSTRAILWAVFAICSFPAYVFGASSIVSLFVKHKLELTAAEISAPHSMFSIRSTHVQLSTVTRVSLEILQDGHRYLNIYYKGGRLGIAETFMPSPEAFNRILMAFCNTPGANNSFKADASGAA